MGSRRLTAIVVCAVLGGIWGVLIGGRQPPRPLQDDLIVQHNPEPEALPIGVSEVIAAVPIPAEAPVDDVLPTDARHAIAGSVHDMDGAPVEGATVKASGLSGGGARPVTTDARGRFVIEGLTAEVYDVVVLARGYNDAALGRVRPGSIDLSVTLKSLEVISGRVLGENGKPLERFAVNGVERTWPGGRFEIERGRKQSLQLVIRAANLADLRRGIELLAHHALDLGDLVMTKGRKVTGLVTGPKGEAIAGADVECTIDKAAVAQAHSSGGGRFTLERVPDAPCSLNVRAKGWKPTQQELSAEVSSVAVTLTRGARLEGRVVDELGRPLNGFSMWYRGSAVVDRSGFLVDVRHDGTFQVGGLQPGRLELSAHEVAGMHVPTIPKTTVIIEGGDASVVITARPIRPHAK